MATGGTPEDSEQHAADNVIRFPRDWFGSKDDLIPIGSAADRLEEEAAAAERERDDALSADDFWGGSGALHQPVDAPRTDEKPVSVLPGHRDVVVRSPPLSAAARRRIALPHLAGARNVRTPRAALVLAAMVIAAVALFASGAFGTSAKTTRVASRPAASPTTSVPSLLLQTDQAQLVAASQTAFRGAAKSYVVKAPRTQTTKHVVHKPRRTKTATHHATSSGSNTSSTPAAVQTTAGAASDDVTPASVAPSTASTPVQSDASSSGSSSTSSGPAGLGGEAGNQCNPQCHGS